MSYSLRDYTYTLPPELIAQEAIHPHHDARMMLVDKTTGTLERETTFSHLGEFMPENRIIFFNDSRVLRSRLPLIDASIEKSTGEKILLKNGEIFFLGNRDGEHFEALVQPGNKFKVGNRLFAYGVCFEVQNITDTGRILKISGGNIMDIMKQYGKLPLPPYIGYSEEKEKDYQTVFGKNDGSVAAPTASLHFTEELMQKLPHIKEYVTLHVGLGTFRGIKTDDIRDYAIHSECVQIDRDLFERIAHYKTSEKKIVAVGTTVCRTLESLPYLWNSFEDDVRTSFQKDTQIFWNTITETLEKRPYIQNIVLQNDTGQITFETRIYITPGYQYAIIDDLITNFHLPESSLLVLVSAFMGYRETMNLYQKAIEKKYRFYSFGDGMYIRGK